MKMILLALAVLGVAALAWAQQPPKVYQCVRPDGKVVCTINDPGSDPSGACNYQCVDCNMVCVARLHLSDEGGRMVPVPPPPVQGERRHPDKGAVETREYCQQHYQSCVAKCKSDPDNKTQYDRDACVSSCNSWFSGCGMKP